MNLTKWVISLSFIFISAAYAEEKSPIIVTGIGSASDPFACGSSEEELNIIIDLAKEKSTQDAIVKCNSEVERISDYQVKDKCSFCVRYTASVTALYLCQSASDRKGITRRLMYSALPDASVPVGFTPISLDEAKEALLDEIKEVCKGSIPSFLEWHDWVENRNSYGRQTFWVLGNFGC